MKRTTALFTLGLLIIFLSVATGKEHAIRSAQLLNLTRVGRIEASPQSAQPQRWSSREEYDAFTRMVNEQDNPEAQISLAQAFLRSFPTSDFTAAAYLAEMRSYYRRSKIGQALEAARNVLKFDRDNLEALTFLSYAFPFTFAAGEPYAFARLSSAERDARRGLDTLGKLKKPDNQPDSPFKAFVIAERAVFSRAMGFVAFERNEYAGAIAALNAAAQDNPEDVHTFKWMGLAYLNLRPPDYVHGIWYLSRAAGLAAISRNPSSEPIRDYLRKTYFRQHESDVRLEATITQALNSVNPPNGPHSPRAPRPGTSPRPIAPEAAGPHKPSVLPAPGGNSQGPTYSGLGPIYPGWIPPSGYSEDDHVPLPAPAEADEQIAAQLNYLAEQIDMMDQEQAMQDTRAPVPLEPAAPEPDPPSIVLVYKDGHKVEVQNYAIVGQTLVWFSFQLSRKIPLADLDLPATRKVNEDHGVQFVVPDQP